MIANSTLQINRRSSMFVKDEQTYIKLSRPHPFSDKKSDLYVMKKLSVDELKRIHEWTGEVLKHLNSSQYQGIK